MSTNLERAKRARAVLRVHQRLLGQKPCNPREPLQTQIVDLLTDLLHLCEKSKEDAEVSSALELASRHFSDELYTEQVEAST